MRAALIVALVALGAAAPTAILECTANRVARGALELEFRTGPAAGWSVARASLLLHVAGNAPPARLSVNGKSAPVETKPNGWLTVAVAPRVAEDLLAGRIGALRVTGTRAERISRRETPQFAPYLIVEGSTTIGSCQGCLKESPRWSPEPARESARESRSNWRGTAAASR